MAGDRDEVRIALRMAEAKERLADWIEKEPILGQVAIYTDSLGMTTEEMAVMAVSHLCEALKTYKAALDKALLYAPPPPILVQTNATTEELLERFFKESDIKPKKEGD